MNANTSSVPVVVSCHSHPVIEPDVLFIEDVAQLLRASRTTIERRRRDGSLPFPELPAIDKRPRWSRRAVEGLLSSGSRVHRRQPRQPFVPMRMKA
jgi:hypothetical protein